MLARIKKTLTGTFLEPIARRVQLILKIGWSTDDLLIEKIIKKTLKPVSNCIDVGCHRGLFLRYFLRYAPNGLHFAFEPLPDFYQILSEEYSRKKNVHLYKIALSDIAGKTSFQHVINNPAMSGLRERKYNNPDEMVIKISVNTELLDHIIPEHIFIDFIKIDVEGAELQVLQGAVNTIKRCQPVIVFEHGSGAADYYGTKPEQVFDLLTKTCNLKLSLLQTFLEKGGTVSLDRESFCSEFTIGKNYNFVAYPLS